MNVETRIVLLSALGAIVAIALVTLAHRQASYKACLEKATSPEQCKDMQP